MNTDSDTNPSPKHHEGEEQQHEQKGTNKEEQPYRLRTFAEPKGFLRFLEVFLAILMFATTTAYHGIYYYTITCQETSSTYDKKYAFAYPFDLPPFPVFCEPSNTTIPNKVIDAHPGPSASFFVVIGVFALLYAISSLLWYVFFEVKFVKLTAVQTADFITTVVFAVLFFIASCAWAAGVSSVKYWTDFDNISQYLFTDFCSNDTHICTKGITATYTSLNVSILFGFLNCFLWSANGWFTFKDTQWFGNWKQQSNKPDTTIDSPPNDV